MENDTVEVLFISRNGISFLGNEKEPGSFIQKIRNFHGEQVLTDYVFFGHARNRLIYHEIDYDDETIVELH